MDPTFASDRTSWLEPLARPGRWRAAFAEWVTAKTTVGRARPMSLAPARVVLGVAAVLLISVATSLGLWWWQQGREAQADADAALTYVDGRLDALQTQLARVAAHPLLQGPSQSCTTALVALMVRESLSSLLIQQVMVIGADGTAGCGPDGEVPAPDVPPVHTDSLALVTQRAISLQLMVLRTAPAGGVLLATLDPRSFVPDATQTWARSPQRRVTLMSADARALTSWVGVAGAPSNGIDALRATRSSLRHQVAVVVDVNRQAALIDALQRAACVAGFAMLLALLALAWYWQRTLRRARLYHRLVKALRKRQFEPFVQPIVDVATGLCVGGEVLMRWQHPQRGLLGPGEFIEEAERTGLIVAMSQLVMARAAHRLAPLAHAHPQLYFSFNITPEQLRDSRFAQQLAELFRADTLAREQVLLELTEREFVDPAAMQTLMSLRAAGWRIAIDDFGTGQSSLATIDQLPIHRIKIDRAFVSTIDDSTVSRPVLDTIITLAHQLQIGLIAEGVETQKQWDYLAARQVGCVQGFLIARPMPIEAFVRWASEHAPAAAAAAAADAAAFATSSTPAPPTAALAVMRTLGATAYASASASHSTETEADLLALRERLASTGGLDIRDRVYRLRSYEQCFVGREAVDWLQRHLMGSRDQALRTGRRLLALGHIEHVLDEHDFEDAELFYRIAQHADATGHSAAPAATELVHALNAAHGLAWTDQVRGLLCHRACQPGQVIVDWLCQRYQVPRRTATQWAVQLMRQGRLRHVFDDEPFRDDATLYRPG